MTVSGSGGWLENPVLFHDFFWRWWENHLYMGGSRGFPLPRLVPRGYQIACFKFETGGYSISAAGKISPGYTFGVPKANGWWSCESNQTLFRLRIFTYSNIFRLTTTLRWFQIAPFVIPGPWGWLAPSHYSESSGGITSGNFTYSSDWKSPCWTGKSSNVFECAKPKAIFFGMRFQPSPVMIALWNWLNPTL